MTKRKRNKPKEKEYYKKNIEHISAIMKKYREENKEAISIYQKKYREDNRDKIKELRKVEGYEKELKTIYNHEYHKKNKDKIDTQISKWRKKNRRYLNEHAKLLNLIKKSEQIENSTSDPIEYKKAHSNTEILKAEKKILSLLKKKKKAYNKTLYSDEILKYRKLIKHYNKVIKEIDAPVKEKSYYKKEVIEDNLFPADIYRKVSDMKQQSRIDEYMSSRSKY